MIISHSTTDPPQVTLSLGSTLNPDDIKEGDDVYFECHIKANPKEHRITWSHDVSVQCLWIWLAEKLSLRSNNMQRKKKERLILNRFISPDDKKPSRVPFFSYHIR